MEDLLQFLYLMPVGVLKFCAGGTIEMMNPVATALLLSMTSPEALRDIYSALASIAPDLRQRVARFEGQAGVIVDQHGFIITNRHVVASAKSIIVVLADETKIAAELVVADDGVGVAPNCHEGLGTGIINGLCLALDGQIKRTAIVTGGLHISIFFPLLPAEYAGRSGR